MGNRAYLSVWCRDFRDVALAQTLARFLETIPFPNSRAEFASLCIRAVNPSMAPVAEYDLRPRPATAAEIVELAQEHLQPDAAFEIECEWDLWVFDTAEGKWQDRPQRLVLECLGELYDDGAFEEWGHLRAHIGFEHLFTGHANLLGLAGRSVAAAQHPVEAAFLERMSEPGNLGEYYEKTQANIRRLLDWTRHLEKTLPVARYLLWSEGEDNFEARLEEILATH